MKTPKQIEPGCLALIIRSYLPGNLGKVVRVLKQAPSDYVPPGAPKNSVTPYREPGKKVWVVSVEDPAFLMGFIFKHTGEMSIFKTHERGFENSCLLRIDSDPEDVEQYSEIKELEIIT